MKPVVYIAGKYRATSVHGIVRNIMAARELAATLWSFGFAAICPHLNTALMDGVCRDADFLEGDLEILRRCDAVLTLPYWEQSEGARGEVAEAVRRGIPVFHTVAELREWHSARKANRQEPKQ